ncbi:MAG: hypothetical protein AAB890_00670 [Patescibacteria group bacterium]
MELLNWRNLLIVFILWGLIFSGGLFWQEKLSEQTNQRYKIARKTIELPPVKEFTFDKPTAEEQKKIEVEEENFKKNDEEELVTIPLKSAIKVFQCDKKNCGLLGKFDPGTELKFNLQLIDPDSKWLSVPWPDPSAGPKTGYIQIIDLETAVQEPPILPQVILDVTDIKLEPINPVDINPQTIVGIMCEFYNPETKETKTTRGSGVIVTDEGHILTARSLINLNYLNEGLENFKIENCLVGSIPQSESLPSLEAIQRLNAFARIPLLPYIAEVFYAPNEIGLSEYEKSWLDFSIIQINDLNPDAKFFGITKIPDKFPYAPMLISDIPKINEMVLSFGFPSEATVSNKTDTKTLFIQGLISRVVNYWAGDSRYDEDLFMIETRPDAGGTSGGRFGSPIFWKGYVIGIHTVKQRESLQVFNISAKAILANLYDNGIGVLLEVY